MHRLELWRPPKTVGLLLLSLCLVGCASWPPPARAVVRPSLERISFAERSDGAGFVVRLHTTAQVSAYTEPVVEGGVMRMTLFNVVLGDGAMGGQGEGPVEVYQLVPDGDHVQLQLTFRSGTQVQAEAYLDHASEDLLLALTSGAAPTPITVTASEIGRGDAAPAQPPARAGEAAGSSRWTLDTVVIDAGHGGHDTGAIGAGGLREKDVTLAVALKVGAYVEEKLGLNVVYTRDSDEFITLRDRGHIGNQAGGKLFVSIHANAARSRTAQGTETYILGLHKSASAQKVMERENSVVRLEEDAEAYTDLDEQTLIMQTLASSSYLRKSEDLAALVESQFAERVGRQSRGVKQAGFYVLWGASMPAVLVELGFITNPAEAAFLKSEAGQTYMASAIFRAIRDFKAQYERDLGL